MSTASFNGLLIISVIAVMAPILAASAKRVKLPSVVVEITTGVIVGPSVLAWVKIDQPVNVVALLGLAFLLFLAGLEIDLRATTPSQLRAPLAGFAGSLLLGSVAGVVFHAVGWVRNPFFLAITLSATSLGLVVPVLTDAGQSRTVFGQLTIAGATLGEFGAITLLSLFFSATKGGTASNVIAFGTFSVLVAAVGVTLGRAGKSLRLDAFLSRLQDTTAEIRVRIAVALLIGFVALAAKIGLQTILGAFLAGVVLNLADRDIASHPVFRSKLNALGYGFLIPVFFVSSGVEFDLGALTRSPSAVARIPLFLLALLIVRGAPAALYAHALGRRGAVAAGLLQATSLPVIVTAASIGLAIHAVAPVTASALVAAGLLSVLMFPLAALSVIRAGHIEPAAPHATPPTRGAPHACDDQPVQKEGLPCLAMPSPGPQAT
jgi:Kef-type K+ transport system membrane component KefB